MQHQPLPKHRPSAQAMKRNLEFNGGAAAAKIRPQEGDARIVMMQNAGVRVSLSMPWHSSQNMRGRLRLQQGDARL